MTSETKGLAQQLIRATRWKALSSSANASTSHFTHPKKQKHLPCFSLQRHHFGRIDSNALLNSQTAQTIVPTPSDFHRHLCNKIKHARDRVILASLYIGVGSNHNKATKVMTREIHCKEDDLLYALNVAAMNPSINKIQILLDANRALRKVSYTSSKSAQSHSADLGMDRTYSAKAVYSELATFLNKREEHGNGVFLFPVNDFKLCSILPSPLGEVAGVFHIKAYIIDDELILSGANLSEEYFTNRLDRYMSFTNGGGGLVDFYAELCDVMCKYASKYDENWHDSASLTSLLPSDNVFTKKQLLEDSLIHLFNGERFDSANTDNSPKPVAYAVPTFQMPESFLGRQLRFPSDAHTTRNLLQSALDNETSLSVRLSSAYLNLTPNLLSTLRKFGKSKTDRLIDDAAVDDNSSVYILTAGMISHGFAKRQKTSKRSNGIVSRIKDSIPDAFLSIVNKIAELIVDRGGKVLLYERAGWTFHAKGLWIATDEQQSRVRHKQIEIIHDPSSLVSTIIGSGNYGARSEDLDVESNLVLVFNDLTDPSGEESSLEVKRQIAEEWNDMCRHSNELKKNNPSIGAEHRIMELLLGLLKRFL